MKLDQECLSQTDSAECQPASGVLRRKLLAWLAVLVWMIVIYLFSDQPYSGRVTATYLGDANIPIRKLAHITEYAILLVVCRRAWKLSFPSGLPSRLPGMTALVLVFLYALSDEWHQSFVPGRSATFSDVLVDTSGAIVGLFVLLLSSRLKKPGTAQRSGQSDA